MGFTRVTVRVPPTLKAKYQYHVQEKNAALTAKEAEETTLTAEVIKLINEDCSGKSECPDNWIVGGRWKDCENLAFNIDTELWEKFKRLCLGMRARPGRRIVQLMDYSASKGDSLYNFMENLTKETDSTLSGDEVRAKVREMKPDLIPHQQHILYGISISGRHIYIEPRVMDDVAFRVVQEWQITSQNAKNVTVLAVHDPFI